MSQTCLTIQIIVVENMISSETLLLQAIWIIGKI